VLVQGTATVDLRPSRARLEALTPQAERYVGKVVRGPVWDRLLREYYAERVFVDIAVQRAAVWPDLSASGAMEVAGAAWPGFADPQPPPGNGTGSRVAVAKAARRIATLPHRGAGLLGADGYRSSCRCRSPGITVRACTWSWPPGCSRRALAARACLPTPAGRSWSG